MFNHPGKVCGKYLLRSLSLRPSHLSWFLSAKSHKITKKYIQVLLVINCSVFIPRCSHMLLRKHLVC